MGFWDSFLSWLRRKWNCLTILTDIILNQTGGYSEDMLPTVGFNIRKVTKGNVTIKLWDLSGQRRFRSMWERYCRGVSAILYVVDAADRDAADRDSIPISRRELHDLVKNPSSSRIPLLVLETKSTNQKLFQGKPWSISWTR